MDDIMKMGRNRTQNKRPIPLKLTKENTRTEIQKNAKEFRETEIWIDEDHHKKYTMKESQ